MPLGEFGADDSCYLLVCVVIESPDLFACWAGGIGYNGEAA